MNSWSRMGEIARRDQRRRVRLDLYARPRNFDNDRFSGSSSGPLSTDGSVGRFINRLLILTSKFIIACVHYGT